MKRAEFTTKEIMEVIIVIACIFIAIYFFNTLMSSTWNRGDETAASYFNMLEEQIEIADDGGVGEFFIWPIKNREGGGIEYHIVYFGEKLSWSSGRFNFVSMKGGEDNICICASKGDGVSCEDCKSLDLPAVLVPAGPSEQWFFSKGDKLIVRKIENHYEFRVVAEFVEEEEEVEITAGTCPGVELKKIPDTVECVTTYSECKLLPEAVDLLVEADERAEGEGFDLVVTSAYRSYENQEELYNQWLSGESNLIEVAKPGCRAPHTTGGAVDLVLLKGIIVYNDELNDIILAEEEWVPWIERSGDRKVMHYECCGTDRHLAAKGGDESVIST